MWEKGRMGELLSEGKRTMPNDVITNCEWRTGRDILLHWYTLIIISKWYVPYISPPIQVVYSGLLGWHGCTLWKEAPVAPVAVYLAAINAHMLFKQCIENTVPSLAYGLFKGHMRAKAAAKIPREPLREPNCTQLPRRRQCQVARCTKNRTQDICVTCKRHVCGKSVKQVRVAKISVSC